MTKELNIENKTDAPKDNSKGTESVQINKALQAGSSESASMTPDTPPKKKRKIENKLQKKY